MKIKTIVQKKPTAVTSNIINLSISFTDANNTTFSYNLDIPDTYLLMNYRNIKLKKYLEETLKTTYSYTETDTTIDSGFYTTFLSGIISTLSSKYAYKWSQVLRMSYIHFNPEDNVFENTVIENEYGQKVTDVDYGERVTEVSNGQQVKSNVIGATEQTNEYGERVTENSYGEDVTTNVEQTNPFNDTGNLYDKDKSTVTAEEHTDTITNETYTDTQSTIEHTDTLTSNAYTDTTTNETYTDTTTEGTHTDTFTTNRHGNIGVTTTVSMFEEFQNYLNNYGEIWDIIINDIMRDIGRGY